MRRNTSLREFWPLVRPADDCTDRWCRWGVFRLTDPPGVKTIMTCTQKALFHQHPGADGLYTDAMRPGHVVVVKEMEFEVIDLRK